MKGQVAFNAAKKLIHLLYTVEYSKLQKTKKYKEYLSLLRKAAYSGHPEAQFELGQHYEDINFWSVNNPNHNPEKCKYWYAKACKGGHGPACNNLASIYGVEKQHSKALKHFKKAADLGDVLGKKNYALMLKQMANK